MLFEHFALALPLNVTAPCYAYASQKASNFRFKRALSQSTDWYLGL